MNVYADTSFLFAVYMPESNTPIVRGYLKKRRQSLVFTSLQRYELRNAIRLAVFRHYVDRSIAEAALISIEEHLELGHLDDTPLTWPDVLTMADTLSAQHTMTKGVRSLDLLHVAAAKMIGAKTFLTFDVRQHTLAKAAGLRVGP